jgi:hypothetical protein
MQAAFAQNTSGSKRRIKMRKVIVGEYVSPDGAIEGPTQGDPYEHAGWADPYNSEEAQEVVYVIGGGNVAQQCS